ncbi:MAG: hypothetical protein QM652_09200 [Legionella sp.]|uniref:hypothetical protein n=1 Tax=Legionella sp. TaxID=459 RepID=UPI0039E256B1
MSQSKEEQQLTPKDFNNDFNLNDVVIEAISSHLSVEDELSLMYSSITTHNLFKPHLLSIKARECVVLGNVSTLEYIAKKDPLALFQKGEVTDADECTFYNVSAYQLIQFLCDADMKKQLLSWIPDAFLSAIQKQTTELGCGGADLIKLDRDPLVMASQEFTGFTQFKQTFTLFDHTPHELSFPLLENPDGIAYYADSNDVVTFYYIKKATEQVVPIEPSFSSEEDKASFETFKDSFKVMENNSSRRSSNAEHQLIERIFEYPLHRQGILYKQNDIYTRDSRTAFSLINAYRTSIRLYNEATQTAHWDRDKWDKADIYWREGVGNAQRKLMWLLQRIYEKNRPFYPIPTQFNDFNRDFRFGNFNGAKEESAVVSGKIIGALGVKFGLYKAWEQAPAEHVLSLLGRLAAGAALVDLVAVFRLIDDAKANIMELSHESKPDVQSRSVRSPN